MTYKELAEHILNKMTEEHQQKKIMIYDDESGCFCDAKLDTVDLCAESCISYGVDYGDPYFLIKN